MPENASCSGAATCSKESCEGCASKQNPQSMLEAMNAYSDVKHVIGVVSGKQRLLQSRWQKPDIK